MSITVTYFQRPTGARKELEVTEINADDEAWFNEHRVAISMEDDMTNDSFICYADWGAKDAEGEPIEAIEFSLNKSCRETLSRLREVTQHMMDKHRES